MGLTTGSKDSNVVRAEINFEEICMNKDVSKKHRFLQGTAVLVAMLAGGLLADTAGAKDAPSANKSYDQSQSKFVASHESRLDLPCLCGPPTWRCC